METLLYNGFELNEWLFSRLYMLNLPILDSIWGTVNHGYGIWAVAGVFAVTCFRYLRIRQTATEHQLESMGEFLIGLITAFSIVWCVTYTLQHITLMPRPWTTLPDIVTAQPAHLGYEGLSASVSAIAIMLASLAWKRVGFQARCWLVVYVAVGCLLSMISGVNWPVEIAVGALIGWAGASIGQRYFFLGRRLVAS